MSTAESLNTSPVSTSSKAKSAPSIVEDALGIERFTIAKFVRSFEVVCQAGGGTQSLKQLVLEFAIHGRLSATTADDDDVQHLLKAAKADCSARLLRGEARQIDELNSVSSADMPFSLPATWVWTRIGSAMNLVNGRAFKPKDWSTSGLPIVRIQNLNNAAAPFNYCAFEVDTKHRLRSGDFLISWSGTPGTSFGAFIWNGPDGVLNQHIFRAEVYGAAFNLQFLRIAINARLDEMIAQAHGGVGLQHITKGRLEALPIPLPPLAEQKRIVARVNQLTALVDELEAKQTRKRDVGARFTKASLAALTSAEEPAEFETAWKRVIENWEVVLDRPEKVAEVRKAMTALALRGHLAARDPRDGGTETLLAELSQRGLTVRLAVDEALPLLPASWRWVAFGSLLTFGPKNGYSPKGVEHKTSVKSLTLTATTSGTFDGRHFKYIDEVVPADSDLWLHDGDILIQRGNTIDYVGVAAIYRGPQRTFIYPDLMMKVRVDEAVDLDFIHLALNGPLARQFIMSRASGTSGSMPKINQGALLDIPIPLPPSNEQQRIANRHRALMKVCDDLEAKLRRAEDRASKLVEAVVQELVG